MPDTIYIRYPIQSAYTVDLLAETDRLQQLRSALDRPSFKRRFLTTTPWEDEVRVGVA